MNQNDRLDALETKIAFQDEHITKLDEASINQQQQIFDLQRQLKWLGLQLKEMEQQMPGQDGPEPPPPHY